MARLAKLRFLFASDFHGNETVWRKFLNSAGIFKVDALIMGGDMTGKLLCPIIKREDGLYESFFLRENHVITEEQLPQFKRKVVDQSYIPYCCTREEYEQLNQGQEIVEKVFEKLESEVVREWCDLIPQKVPENVKVVVHPGNDDKFAIDEVLRNHPSVIFAEEDVVSFDGEHEAACVGWSNRTPWDSPRECSEEELRNKLDRTILKLTNLETSLFCFHVPPRDSVIDKAAKLDEQLRPVYEGGRPIMIPVGSVSVRRAIEKYQPLLGLHGHIHESPGIYKIGRTQCLNPGSEYSEGILKAYLVELDGKKIIRLQRLEG